LEFLKFLKWKKSKNAIKGTKTKSLLPFDLERSETFALLPETISRVPTVSFLRRFFQVIHNSYACNFIFSFSIFNGLIFCIFHFSVYGFFDLT